MALYQAKDLASIAAQFERMAKNADDQERRATTRKDQRFYAGEGIAWRAAAQILLNTELVS
jgi:hypothetical protein